MNFYDDEVDLIVAVTDFAFAGLTAGESVVLVADSSHCEAVARRLGLFGLDVERARASGQLRFLDAAATLAAFLAGSQPDPHRFQRVIGGVLDEAGAGGRAVRVFGEMVALLWNAGNTHGAVALEAMWNDLARTRPFSLYCAYPTASVAGGGDLGAASAVCGHHTLVVAPRSYNVSTPVGMGDGDERSASFLPVPSAVAAARRFVRETLGAWGLHDLVDDATLVASELATNAVRHAGSAFELSIGHHGAAVRVAVRDISAAPPAHLDASLEALGGRGIAMVDRIAVSWGIEARPDGKVVWSDLVSSRPLG